MRELTLVSKSNVLLGRNFNCFGGYLVVTARCLVVTARYLVVTACCHLLLLVLTFSMNDLRRCFTWKCSFIRV